MKNYKISDHDIYFRINNSIENYSIFKNKQKLIDSKSKIDNYEQKKWDKVKKLLNEYEFIYTSSNISRNICSIVPVSRSYFKLHEILHDFNLFSLIKNEETIITCIAEGPGGFIHCLNNNLKDINYEIHGITLITNDPRIPFWNKQIINNPKNYLSYGKDNTGDIYSYENVKNFIQKIKKTNKKCLLVTADGGFDYSDDYNSQEIATYKLLFSEIFIALNVQSENGTFIIKVFDLFNYVTVQLLYILYTCYSSINIYKPTLSRLSNSEKYIVCSGFKNASKDILDCLNKNFNCLNRFFIYVPESFIQNINEFNEKYTENQIKNIESIIGFIDKKKTDNIKDKPNENQLKKAIEWCEFYNLPLNNNCMFLR